MKKIIQSIIVLAALFLIQGCKAANADMLNQFSQVFADEKRVNSLILPSVYGEGDTFKIPLHTSIDSSELSARACSFSNVQDDLNAYQNEIDTMKNGYTETLKTLHYEEIAPKELSGAQLLIMLESKDGADIQSLALYDNHIFVIKKDTASTFFSIQKDSVEQLTQIYKQFYEYYTNPDTAPCWTSEWAEYIEN